jgi:hypothetical protein
MPKHRGNPNWCRPQSSGVAPSLSTFEHVVRSLGLTPEKYIDSSELKQWVIQNKDHKYVPPELLTAWGVEVKSEAGE